ncbi:hypothetical protein K439DRAFT_1622741 [Ramaria rubella]|nr:hypothetical protein K439DRAFT_1622741 [Ramaria rubella]
MVPQDSPILRHSIASFEIAQTASMSPTDGTAASCACKKQHSNLSPDSTIPSPLLNIDPPGSSPFPPFSTTVTPEDCLNSLEKSVGVLITIMHQAQQIAQQQGPLQLLQQPQQQPPQPIQPQPQAPPQPQQSQQHQQQQPFFTPSHLQPTVLHSSAIPTPFAPASFIPPISLNPAAGALSLDRSFPHVNTALSLAITRHELRPGHLFKLNSTIKDKPRPKTFKLSESGNFTQHDRDASPKDYPSFRAVFDPLSTYFEILQYFIISARHIPSIQQVVLGSSEYLHILYHLYMCYEWSAVLQYHFMFHNRRLAEM